MTELDKMILEVQVIQRMLQEESWKANTYKDFN